MSGSVRYDKFVQDKQVRTGYFRLLQVMPC